MFGCLAGVMFGIALLKESKEEVSWNRSHYFVDNVAAWTHHWKVYSMAKAPNCWEPKKNDLGAASRQENADLLDFVQITFPFPSPRFRQLVQLFFTPKTSI